MKSITPTGNEINFGEEDIIVSKTDAKGIITYANRVFLKVSGYQEEDVVGKPHNLIRHPDMPRCMFAMLWERLKAGHEIFVYVKNMASNGDHYWALAHVTPTKDENGNITNFHSNRRWAERRAVDAIEPLYQRLREEERRHTNAREASEAGKRLLLSMLEEQGKTYDQFVWSL